MKILPLTKFMKEIEVPGDKSISHRALMLSSLSDAPVEIANCLRGADCLSTAACLSKLGAKIEFGKNVTVQPMPKSYILNPVNLDCGNSGTTLRLMLGLTAALNMPVSFTGDESLSRRPMGRVTKPLTMMGGKFTADKLPITVQTDKPLRGITYALPVASAQVKSAILLAGLFAEGATTVIEKIPTRNHTENMLSAFGANIEVAGNEITIAPSKLTSPGKIVVPGDISSAAYWIVLGSILPDSRIVLKNVGVNPTRTGLIDVLRGMGAKIEFGNQKVSGGEISTDLTVYSSCLHGVEIASEMIPRLIDEIPVLAVAAAFAEGTTKFAEVGELRVKESDRLAAILSQFNKICPAFEVEGDNLIVHGGRKKTFAACETFADHRMAMSLAIFGAAAEGVELDDTDCVKISYPNFFSNIHA